MYHDLFFSTCHRVNVGGIVSHVFLPRKGQQQILTFFFQESWQRSLPSVTESWDPACCTCGIPDCHRIPWTTGWFCGPGGWGPKESGEKCYFVRPPPWIKGWNWMLAVFSFTEGIITWDPPLNVRGGCFASWGLCMPHKSPRTHCRASLTLWSFLGGSPKQDDQS